LAFEGQFAKKKELIRKPWLRLFQYGGAMKLKIIAVGAAALLIAGSVATGAHASTYDFISYIDGQGGAKNGTGGEKGVISPFTILDTTNTESLTITAHGTNYNSVHGSFSAFPYAYFDYGNAGIGVCQVLSGTQCAPASDDNVTGPPDNGGPTEILSLAFTEDLRLEQLLFRNDGHTPTFGTGKSVKIAVSNGMGTLDVGSFTSYALDVVSDGGLIGAALLGLGQVNLNTGDFVHVMYDNQQFYLSGMEVSAVPLPPSSILFGTALLGIGAVSRRRKKKTA